MAEIEELDKLPWEGEEVESLPWESPMNEQEGQAIATEAAARKFEETEPGYLETIGGHLGQGISFGTVDEAAAFLAKEKGWTYDDAKQQINKRLLRQKLANPKTAFTADLIGSIVSSFIPGLGVATAPAKMGKAGKVLHGAGQTAKQAGIGFGEGFARGEGEDRLESGVTQAVLGGGLTAGGKALSTMGTMPIPGSKSSPRWLNKLTAKMSESTSKLDEDGAKAYERMLNDDAILAKAFTSPSQLVNDIPKIKADFARAFENINDLISKRYEQKQAKAFLENIQDVGQFKNLVDQLNYQVDGVISKVDGLKPLYTPKTKKILQGVKTILNLHDDEVGNLGKQLQRVEKGMALADSLGDTKKLKAFKNIYKELLPKLGGVLHRARLQVDAGINFKKGESLPKDQKLLLDLRDKIQIMTHELSRGSEEMKAADKLYEAYSKQARPFIEHFKSKKELDGYSGRKAGEFISGSGNIFKQAEIKGFYESAKDFLNKFGMEKEAKTFEDIIEKYSQMGLTLDMARVGGQTGATTGKSNVPLIAGGITGMGIDPAVGAIVAALTVPVATPTVYASTLNNVRKLIGERGEDEVSRMFGRIWPAVKTALTRRLSTSDDVRQSAEEIKAAAGGMAGDAFEEVKGLDTGRIPSKIRNYLKGRGQN